MAENINLNSGASCRKCKAPVEEKAVWCPECGVHNPDLSTGQLWLGSGLLIIIAILIFQFFTSGSDSEADIRQGFHCLSKIDGTHFDFKSDVKARLRDPKSFDHTETRITPVGGNGKHVIYMDYRAKNGLGGLNVETAIGTVDNKTCDHTITKIA